MQFDSSSPDSEVRAPTIAGWYPDPARPGGTRYSDGSQWTGVTRPRRKPFAAAGHHKSWWMVFSLGVAVIITGVFSSPLDLDVSEAGGALEYFVSASLMGGALIALSIYLRRGQGPTTRELERRVEAAREEDESRIEAAKVREEQEAAARRRAANTASIFSVFGRQSKQSASLSAGSEESVAQINAIASPETAQALQNLQNLLFTQVLTDAEFQAAKDRLLGPAHKTNQAEQIEQLATLHRRGVLGDLEFAKAKARILGL